ncbi:TPA: hypothetical protein KKW74_002720 [Legionella pneumophila]|uniref:hypothetical protein n=1 Tax=Legionella pneumophila TaxID=446 RepID=UPI0005B468B1|nr:hypothetical protein [Legionella pneumophila]TIG73104.1 hypothetical protein DI119_15390 [Legionella pneumophila]HAT6979781.1 hypothetical protein [Legionella pneumophila]HAT8803713.1 hypothetical protein [Legionella pneumophila]HAU1991148.1 hypothetical protein [Legionella pneumophila]HAU2198088.1 hypothetical protein [Legionella pneumophila]
MPNLEDVLKERNKKKFVKKSYRPWDLSGDNTTSDHAPNSDEKPSIPEPNREMDGSFQLLEFRQEKQDLDIDLGNNEVTKEKQQDNINVPIENNIGINKIVPQASIRYQIDSTIDATSLYNRILRLTGIQKSILNFITDVCTVRNSLETGPIETITIATLSKTTIGTVKTSLNRLIKNGLVIRNIGKKARMGYLNLGLTKEVLDTILEQRQKYNHISNSAEFITAFRYQLDNNVPNSSNNILKNTTTKKIEITIPEEWQKIDFESLSHIGFSKTQIKQLVERNDPDVVQESINHFAYGLDNNPKYKKYEDPLTVLMGVLRKGQGWFEKDYRSPKEIAMQQLLEMRKAQAERQKQIEEETFKWALNNWQENMSSEEIEKIAPINRKNGDITPQPAKLSLYFKENVWPKLKKDLIPN